MSAKANAPVIIKRKKKAGGDGHHGGAWKVAMSVPLLIRRFAPAIASPPVRAGCGQPF